MTPDTRHSRKRWKAAIVAGLLTLSFYSIGIEKAVGASRADAYKVQRETVFEFAKTPSVTRRGDTITISFTAESFCDATVAIEDANGRIIRHLASGVLGKNAPMPFKKNSKKQVVIWDGKDDQRKYVDDKDSITVRVSLGLKARFERTLYWSPMKRVGLYRNPALSAQPEGVYVYEGSAVEMIRLFGHDGKYIRTVHPFPADKVKQVNGVKVETGLDGFEYPQKLGYWRSTFLQNGQKDGHRWGSASIGMTIGGGRIATWAEKLDRLTTDGTARGVKLAGPDVYLKQFKVKHPFRPHSAALSPDGKTLYFTAYHTNFRPLGGPIQIPNIVWKHGVYRMDFDKDDPPKLWKGEDDVSGKDDAHFNQPAWVECDAKGRVYVADYYNDRVQVFSPDGKLLKSIKANGPSHIQIHHKTGEIYVFSWRVPWSRKQLKPVKAMLRKFGPVENPKLRATYPVPLGVYDAKSGWWMRVEDDYRVTLDSWTEPATIWLVPCAPFKGEAPRSAAVGNVSLFTEGESKLEPKLDFDIKVQRSLSRIAPPLFQRQRLYVDHRRGTLYVGEAKQINPLIKIDPETGKCSTFPLPFGTEELAIDANGFAYLRAYAKPQNLVVRYVLDSMKQVPYDYGEEKTVVHNYKDIELLSALAAPSKRPVYWHQSGMDVTPRGKLVISCYNRTEEKGDSKVHRVDDDYSPRRYPGRVMYGSVHVFDKHGKWKHEDTIPGLPDGHGTCVDLNGDIYVLISAHRLLAGGKPYGKIAGTIIKFKPGKGKIFSSGRAPVVLKKTPDRPADLAGTYTKNMWVDGAEWMYSGIGIARQSAPCQCFNTRFDTDYFGRTFAPETDRNQVAVLDTNGNLMMRIGRYGNVDDGKPLIPHPLQPMTRSIGGDEVAFVYPVYTGVHTDRRLFVSDPGCGRISGIKLSYHVDKKIALKDVKDQEK